MLRTINSSSIKTKYTSALMAVFAVGLLALGGSAREATPSGAVRADVTPSSRLEAAPQTSAPAFTLSSSRTVTAADRRERLLSTQQRYQRSDGLYKLVQTLHGPDGRAERVQTLFGYIGLGVFRLDEPGKRLVFTGPQIADGSADVAQLLRASELFTREESVAGISTIVWRTNGRAKGDVTEEYRAPSLGGLLVKTVKDSAHGRETVEPTGIQMGEPESGLFRELMTYPVDYSAYEEQVQETERNEPEIGLVMRQLLARCARRGRR